MKIMITTEAEDKSSMTLMIMLRIGNKIITLSFTLMPVLTIKVIGLVIIILSVITITDNNLVIS